MPARLKRPRTTCASASATTSCHGGSARDVHRGRRPRGDMGHGRNDLTGFDHFAERLAVGILADEAWVENVPRIARKGSHAAKWTDWSASFVVHDAHAFTVGLLAGRGSTRNRRHECSP